MASSGDRLRQLEMSEKQLVTCMQSMGLALQELGKEKSAFKQVEMYSSSFVRDIESLENSLNAQINYLAQVSTGQPHEGSQYGTQKSLDMALHRLEHSRSRLKELERMRACHMHELQTVAASNLKREGPEETTNE